MTDILGSKHFLIKSSFRSRTEGAHTGVLLTALSFTRGVSAMLEVEDIDGDDGSRTYSASQFVNSFDFLHATKKVRIDLGQAHSRDLSALDRVVLKLRRHGAGVEVIGLDHVSESLVDRLGTHRDENATVVRH